MWGLTYLYGICSKQDRKLSKGSNRTVGTDKKNEKKHRKCKRKLDPLRKTTKISSQKTI